MSVAHGNPDGRWRHLYVALLFLGAALVLAPFLWIAAAAFKTQIALLTGQVRFTPVLLNFSEVLLSRSSDYVSNFMSSVLVAFASTAIVLVVAFLAAYSLFRLRWSAWVVTAILVWAMAFQLIPPVALASAWYEMFRNIGLSNPYVALVLAHTALHAPMALWLLSSFMKDLPHEFEEAAFMDGATYPDVLLRIILPLVAPGLVSAGLLVFIFSWNEFPVALALTSGTSATVPVAIAKFAQQNEIKHTQMAAASVLSAIPALVALLLGQRFIVRGLTAGALK